MWLSMPELHLENYHSNFVHSFNKNKKYFENIFSMLNLNVMYNDIIAGFTNSYHRRSDNIDLDILCCDMG